MDESPDACEGYEPRTINIRGVCNKYIAYGPAMVGYLRYTATIKVLATTFSCSTGDWSLGRTLIILI